MPNISTVSAALSDRPDLVPSGHCDTRMQRPVLSDKLPVEQFRAWYWLKKELQAYCRTHGLCGSGSKEDLTARILAHLSGHTRPAEGAAAARPTRQAMPSVLTSATVITPGWRLNAVLRSFFVQHTAPGFRFNQALRDLLAHPQGRTLGQALEIYRASLQAPRPQIGRQFQFNQHIRTFFASHPGATRAQALQAWREKRQSPQILEFPSSEP